MMKIFFKIMFLLIPFCSFTQINIDRELKSKLEGKTKFHDVKSLVINHYNEKLTALSVVDSVERKNIMRQLKHWNRQFWIDEYYINGSGKVENKGLVDLNGVNEAKRMRTGDSGSRNQPLDWFLQGPLTSEHGIGRIDVLALHPTGLNTIFAGSPHGGLFKSFNNGESWQAISSYLPSLGVAGIAVNPINPNIMYILSGDRNSGNFYSAKSIGVFKTIDGGISWNKCSNLPPAAYTSRDILINPSDPQKLLVATSAGIFYSYDGGISWGPSNITNNIWDMDYKPGDSNIVYAVGNNTFNKSIDGGLTFIPVGIVDLNLASRISIAVTPANPSKIALLAGRADTINELIGVYISTNSGFSFTKTYSDTSDDLFKNYIDLNVSNGQINYNNCIAISSTNEYRIVVGGLCIWASGDGGYTWVQETAYWPASDIFDEYIHPDQHALMYKADGTLFIGNDGGVYKSTNDADICDYKSNGLSTTQFYHFERKNNNNSIWGGAQDNGMLEHETNGNYSLYSTGDGYDMMTDHDYNVSNGEGNDQFYTVNEGIRRYSFLNPWDTDISVPGNSSFFGNLAMSPDDESDIWVGYLQGLYKSINSGNTWSLAGTSPANWAISTTRNNPDIVYVAGIYLYNIGGIPGGIPGGIRKYVSGIWYDMTPGLLTLGYNQVDKISDIDVHADDDEKVYICLGGLSATHKVFFTNNGGDTWQNWTYNLPNVPIFSIKRDGNDGVYVGTSIGVFYKRPNINYWEPFSNSLPPTPVTEIELWMEGNVPEIWVSTFGRGIWFTKQYTSCVSTLSLTGDLNGNQYKEASNLLISTQNLGIGEGNDIKYNTSGKIILQDGFKAKSGTKFKTYSSGCGGQVD